MSAAIPDDEKGFIRAILDDPDELTIWLAYADWLDDRGDPRSEFLRLTAERRQRPADDPIMPALDARLSELRATLDPHWMMAFDPAQLIGCPMTRWELGCPGCWDRLTATDELDIRICHRCKQPVFFCHTLEEAGQFISCGQRVALSTRCRNAAQETPDEEPLDDTWDAGLPVVAVPEPPITETVEWPPAGPPPPPEPPATPPAPPPTPPRPWWRFW